MSTDTLVNWLHYLIILCIIMIPFLPIPMLKWAIYIPLLIVMIWLGTDGICPISTMANISKNSGFVYEQVQKILPSVSLKMTNQLLYIILLVIVVVSHYRIVRSYTTKKDVEQTI